MARVLVTGAAGFIGFHLSRWLLARGHEVVGLDNLNDYYDVRLKEDRLAQLLEQPGFRFERLDLADREGMEQLFSRERPQRVVNLAAQAGVRYSVRHPHAYMESNVVGFLNVLEGCRNYGAEHLVYASSSSVYGANSRMPLSVHDTADHPVSLYAATKRTNELMAHSYAHLYGLPCTGLRFFTVYGPWGRPDMAYFAFTRAILEGRPIELFNHGQMKRDFTYVDDVVEGVGRALERPPGGDPSWSAEAPDPATSSAPYRLYNIGKSTPDELTRFVAVLERALGRRARLNLLPMQPGDVVETHAEMDGLLRDIGFHPTTPLEVGIPRFVDWYCDYYGVARPARAQAAALAAA